MRHITLLLENGTIDDLNKIKEFCKVENIEFEYRYSKDKYFNKISDDLNDGKLAPLYYFSIIGNTDHFSRLKDILGEKLLTTDFADICNVADMDDNFENDLKDVLDKMNARRNTESISNRTFSKFLLSIDDIRVLKALNSYSCYFSEYQKKMLRDRIDVCNGHKERFVEEMTSNILSLKCNVRELRLKTGMNRREFCDYFEIPYRTVEDWENGKSTCAIYLYKLMEKNLIDNGYIS